MSATPVSTPTTLWSLTFALCRTNCTYKEESCSAEKPYLFSTEAQAKAAAEPLLLEHILEYKTPTELLESCPDHFVQALGNQIQLRESADLEEVYDLSGVKQMDEECSDEIPAWSYLIAPVVVDAPMPINATVDKSALVLLRPDNRAPQNKRKETATTANDEPASKAAKQ